MSSNKLLADTQIESNGPVLHNYLIKFTCVSKCWKTDAQKAYSSVIGFIYHSVIFLCHYYLVTRRSLLPVTVHSTSFIRGASNFFPSVFYLQIVPLASRLSSPSKRLTRILSSRCIITFISITPSFSMFSLPLLSVERPLTLIAQYFGYFFPLSFNFD